MGHVNYHEIQRNDRKGLLYFKDDLNTPFKWKAYRFLLNTTAPLEWKATDEKMGYPKLLNG